VITSADVLLVTGGGKGIAAECALDLARSTGARVALLGRSLPEADPELAANLERFRAAGVSFLYKRGDVTDPAAVRAAIGEVVAALGPITGVLHGAGVNTPRLLGQLDAAAVQSTLAPKLGGAENLLAALTPERLRLFITFGSIIARTGMRGEADYALANEWLARWTERLQERYPACRCLALEWSVWAGVGMGERMGRLAALLRQGITPIPLDAGVGMLRRLLARPLPTVSVVVAGRFGAPPTLTIERPELPLLRFLEQPRVYYPGVELVVDTELSAGTDPYLEDHVFRGDRLFPAALGLEAMAQAAIALQGALTGRREPPVFEHASFPRPVVVPEKGSAVIRVAALVRGPGEVEAVLRTAATGFAVDHFRVTCRFEGPPPAEREALPVLAERESVPLEVLGDLYGGVLFHTGRFRRVSGYRQLSATECLADISPDGTTAWFGRYLPADLVLGDPGVRDAAIHGIQACIPHTTLLPVGVERIVSTRLGTSEPYVLAARERERHGDTFVYDLELRDTAGHPRERWEGLTLRAVDSIPAPMAWSLALLAPFLERRLAELIPGAGVRVAMERRLEGGPEGGKAASAAVLRHLLGSRAAVHHRPDGRPEATPVPTPVPTQVPNRSPISVSHSGEVVLAVAGANGGIVGCDLEPVRLRGAALWRDLLGPERFRLAELLAGESGEAADSAATRIWAATECLTKAGGLHGAPLVLGERTADGWQLLRSGERVIGTLAAPVRELGGPAALAVIAVLVGD
jgi:enediyne polyketide synthase